MIGTVTASDLPYALDALPESPFLTKPNSDFAVRAMLPTDAWGDYQPLSGKITINDDTLYESHYGVYQFIDAATFDLNERILRFDLDSDVSIFASLGKNEGISFTGGGSLQIRFAPEKGTTSAFNVAQSSSSLTIDVDDLWLEFASPDDRTEGLIYGGGKLDIRASERAVFLMTGTEDQARAETALIKFVPRGDLDHVIDGREIYFGYGDGFGDGERRGISYEASGGSLTVGSSETTLIRMTNATTGLYLKASDAVARLEADRIEFIAPHSGGSDAIWAANDGYEPFQVILGHTGSEVVIDGYETAIYLEEGVDFVAGTSDAPLLRFEADGDLYSWGGSSLGIAAEQVLLHGSIDAWRGDVSIDFGQSGLWTGHAAEENGTITASMGEGTQWRLTAASTLSKLTARGAVIDLSNADAQGRPQISDAGALTLKVGSFSGEGNLFILGTNLAQGLTSTVTLSGANADADGEHTQYVAVNDVDPTIDLSGIEETLFATVSDESQIIFTGAEQLSSRGLTLLTPGIRSEAGDDGTIHWYLTPVGGETKPGYTPEAMRQSVETGYLLWRAMDEGTRERFGDLRRGAELGAWGRITAGKLSYQGFETDYAAYRLGFDGAPAQNVRVGVLIERLEGNVDGRWGEGDSSMTNVALYGLWLGQNGTYLDAGIRFGRYDETYDNKIALADRFDYDATAYGAWIEAGHAFKLPANLHLTPHVGVNVGRIGGETFKTRVGIEGNTNAVESAILGYGFDIGQTAQTWSAALTLVGKTEMLGDMTFRAATEDGSLSQQWSHSDTWFEGGFSGTFRPTDALETWMSVKRSFGSEIDTDWSINAGLRCRF